MNIVHRAYRRARWVCDMAEARAGAVVFTAAGVALSRRVGLPPGPLARELGTLWADRRITHRVERAIRSMRIRGLVRSTDDLDIAALRRSDTVFILGSGSSVNDLNEADWDTIATSDSIGFNQWLIHSFVPTFYFVELGCSSLEHDRYMVELLCRRLPDLGSMPIIVESKCWIRERSVAYKLPRQLSNRLYFYAPSYHRTTSSPVLAWAMRRSSASWKRGSGDLRTMVHHRASLSAIVLFAFLAGYRDIVLVGVDLNTPYYFWDTNKALLHGRPAPPSDQTGGVHATVDSSLNVAELSLPIDDYLRLLDSSVLRPNGVTLHVASPSSQLCSFLPVYEGLSPGAEGHRHFDAGGAEG